MSKEVHTLTEAKSCSPTCQSFKCGKSAIVYQRDTAWCKWTEEACNVKDCTYAMCVKRRLLPRGVCGETIKRKTVDKPLEEVLDTPVKLHGKALRKLGEKEIF